jgi:hypothetical protein
MLNQRFAPDSAFMEALREAPRGPTEDLAVVRDIIKVCRAFASSPRFASAVLGVMAGGGSLTARPTTGFGSMPKQ